MAVIAMMLFHGMWDLRYFGLVDIDPNTAPGWRIFGHAVASCFLFLSGLSLVLARQRGATTTAALRRLAIVAAAALGVTLATWATVPDGVILFGILHCIVVGNALALPILDAPLLVPLSVGALAALIPHIVGRSLPAYLWWLGLSADVPATLDVRPLLPWISPILFGVVAGRIGHWWLASAVPRVPRLRALEFTGRHSLAVYLLHQPAFIGLLAAMTGKTVPLSPSMNPPFDAPAFLRQCQVECSAAGTDASYCRSACGCALTAARRSRSDAAAIAANCSGGEAQLAGPFKR